MNANLVLGILNMIQAGFTFLTERGITKDRIQAILDQAAGGDIPSEIVQRELDSLQSELDETEDLIDDTFDPSD